MISNDPEFMTCAMDALEEGINPQEIKEECACRLGQPLQEETHNHTSKE